MRTDQIIILILSSLFIFLSVVIFIEGKERLGLFFLFLGSLGLGIFISGLDQFLNLWDEQYHALVAKNLLQDPLKPVLYSEPVLAYNYDNWTANYIWLHKQPLFLWQIALSIKIFGINTLAVRIPSIIMHALLAPIIYRIGKIAVNPVAGFYGALFFSVAFYPLELLTGKFATDHNDIAFLFYVTAGIWAWFEYQNSKKRKWLFLIGIFSGCAVLVKWLTGLLVYGIWAITMGVYDKRSWLRWSAYRPLFFSLLISVLVFLPWQIYIFNQYPDEAAYEFKLNSQHFFHPVEGHGGNFFFHFSSIGEIYGSGFLIPFLLIAGLIMLVKFSRSRIYSAACLSAILLVYIFFSFAATKMVSFCIIVSPFVFLGLGTLTDYVLIRLHSLFKSIRTKRIIDPILILAVCWFIFNFSKIKTLHAESLGKKTEIPNIQQMKFISSLERQLGEGKFVIFNADIRLNGHIPVMYFTDYVAYNFIPTVQQIEDVRKKGYLVAIRKSNSLPEYIQHDSLIVEVE